MSGERDMLTEVTTLARRRVQVEQELRAAIAAAHDAGETITQLAEAAQVTRQTIYRWLAMETGETSGASIQSIRDAVSMLAGYLDSYHASQLHARVNARDEVVLLGGLQMGRAWVTPQVAREMTPEDLAILALAGEAEDRIGRRKRAAEAAFV